MDFLVQTGYRTVRPGIGSGSHTLTGPAVVTQCIYVELGDDGELGIAMDVGLAQ